MDGLKVERKERKEGRIKEESMDRKKKGGVRCRKYEVLMEGA